MALVAQASFDPSSTRVTITKTFRRGSWNLELELITARWQIGVISPEQLPDLATSMLATGLDSPSLRQLAELPQHELENAPSLMDKSLQELGAPELPRKDAGLRVAKAIAVTIVQSETSPYEGARQLSMLCFEMDWPELLVDFDGLVDDYNLLPQVREEIEGEIMSAAREIATNPNPDSLLTKSSWK